MQFKQFIDNGFHSFAYYDTPRAKSKVQVENFFSIMAILHEDSSIGSVKQCHLFVPESETQTRTHVLLFGKAKHLIANLAKPFVLKLIDAAVKQDAEMLGKLYPNAPKHIKLNNEVGMDWVKRNFEHFSEIAEPNLSRSQGTIC